MWVVIRKYTNAQGIENPTIPNDQSKKVTKNEPVGKNDCEGEKIPDLI